MIVVLIPVHELFYVKNKSSVKVPSSSLEIQFNWDLFVEPLLLFLKDPVTELYVLCREELTSYDQVALLGEGGVTYYYGWSDFIAPMLSDILLAMLSRRLTVKLSEDLESQSYHFLPQAIKWCQHTASTPLLVTYLTPPPELQILEQYQLAHMQVLGSWISPGRVMRSLQNLSILESGQYNDSSRSALIVLDNDETLLDNLATHLLDRLRLNSSVVEFVKKLCDQLTVQSYSVDLLSMSARAKDYDMKLQGRCHTRCMLSIAEQVSQEIGYPVKIDPVYSYSYPHHHPGESKTRKLNHMLNIIPYFDRRYRLIILIDDCPSECNASLVEQVGFELLDKYGVELKVCQVERFGYRVTALPALSHAALFAAPRIDTTHQSSSQLDPGEEVSQNMSELSL